jgi:alpha-tubulin suppressor-like RCC1 family protein
MGVFDRLGFNYDSTKFGSGNDLTDGQKLYLNGQTQLKTWQIDDLANSSVSGYFQNPHTANLATLSTLATNIMVYANTANANIVFSDTTTSNVANILFAAANTLYNEIPTFSAHVDRISGVTTSSTKSTVSDYSIAMAVGRQILSITNQTDSIQNNTPILGNFTSLTIGPDIANSVTTLTNDLNGFTSSYTPTTFSTPIIIKNSRFTTASGGFYTNYRATFVIQSNGTLWGWGRNNLGILGLSTAITNRYIPIQIGTASNWTQISFNGVTALAIQSNGTLWSWGANGNGQLGLNTSTSYSSPVQVGSLSTWIQVACGYQNVLAIQSNGTLWSWGANGSGQLGLNTSTSYSSPVQIGSSLWKEVTAGEKYFLAIQSNGSLWSCGYGNRGRLGNNSSTNQSSPVQVGALSTWTKVSGQWDHSLALQSNGSLWGWGRNSAGQCGTSDATGYFLSPVQVGVLNVWTQISAGINYASVAIQSDGTLWNWGQSTNTNGTNLSSPGQVGSLSNWTQICFGNIRMAVQSNGNLWAWGQNEQGQLGISNTTDRSSPVQISTYYSANVNSVSSTSMNTFIIDVQTAYNLLSQRRQGDTNFYVNSLSVLNDYQTLAQFNNLGVTQNYLIDNYIGTTKLKTNLAS